MAHHYNDNGTIYEVAGGKDNDNGTVYEIDHGKYNDNGTVYEVAFAEPITVKLSNNAYSVSYAYVGYNGVKYTTKTTFEINKGDTLQLYVYGDSISAYIEIDGNKVHQGTGTYNYVPQRNVTISFSSGMGLGSRFGAIKVTST